MRIDKIRAIAGPNIYTHKPVLIARLFLEELTEKPSTEIEGFTDRQLKRDVLDDVREVCPFMKPLDESAPALARAAMLHKAGQASEQSFVAARDFAALLIGQLFEIDARDEHGPMAVDVRAGQSPDLV
jgi:hypothetical protein